MPTFIIVACVTHDTIHIGINLLYFAVSVIMAVSINFSRDYAKYPITIFSPVFRFIFTFVMPIAFIAYYPSLVILKPDEIPLLSWLSPGIGILFFYISYKIWMFGAMKYSGTGS